MSPLEMNVIDLKQAARVLGLHANTVCRLARQGKIPGAFKIGSKWRVDVDRLKEETRKQANV